MTMDDALTKCADTLASLSRRMDSLLIRQRTGHEKSRHDAETKDPSEWFFVNHRYKNGTADPKKKFQSLANAQKYIQREAEDYGFDPREYEIIHKGQKIRRRADARVDSAHDALPALCRRRVIRRALIAEELSRQLNLFDL